MNIILEGPDGSGKSTLAKTLNDLFNYPIHHVGNPKTIDDFNNEYSKFLNIIKDDYIIDRISVISENVYSTVFNRTSRIAFDEELSVLKNNNWVMIFCITDILTPEKNKPHKSEDWYNAVDINIEKIKHEYIKIYNILKNKHGSRIILYDYTIHDIYDIVSQINQLKK